MIKKNKIVLALILATTNLSIYAQTPSASTSTSVTTTTVAVNPAPVTQALPVAPPSSGNVYEKEVTPLLREISKKKSLLELRKLDRELEKIDEETVKAQIERDKLSNPATPAGVSALNGSNLPFTPQIFPPGTTPSPQAMPGATPTPAVVNELRVIMIYGYDTNLFAKVAMGDQGGYVVKAGDVLPDGRQVASISPNFIEVSKIKSKSSKTKIFVSGTVTPATTAAAPTANASSVLSVIPTAAPQIMQTQAAPVVPSVTTR